ncbi:MAG: right-handed parallel beta-helix repeat-containing protein [Oscillospiraceae bacterium]|nr:right-handed parallel beta-helix repeat-containing protein [Oscillospiraceae bacterium]
MKKILGTLLAMLMLLTGCAKENVVLETTPPTGSATVNSVDAFLEALETGAEITLEPGCYDLSTASDYGMETDNPWYFWEHSGDGYTLTLTGIHDLTIRGNGAELVTQPRHVNVLALDSCHNVVLEGFNAGHTEGAECAGGVIYAKDCGEVRLKNVGLYGCGTTGLWLDGCIGVTLEDSEIYDCSYTGVDASMTEGLTIRNCTFHDIGDVRGNLEAVFYLDRCKDVTITDCKVSDNHVVWLVNADPGAGIELRDTVFERNRVENAAFASQGSGLVMDGCTFVDNVIHRWCEDVDMTILDGTGKTWTENSLNAWYSSETPQKPAGDRSEVKVSTVDELIGALAPDTEIVLADGVYDLSTAEGYGTASTDYYFWSEEFDGPSLVLTGIHNLVIRSESGDVTKCTLSAVPRYANVLSFRHCSSIAVQGITAGHTVEPGYCMGGVLNFEGCDAVLVENCGLYGCGILGIQASVSSDITVKHCDIYECSYGGIQMGEVNGVSIENCLFRDLGGDSMSFYDCRNVKVDGESISGNTRIE